MSNWTNSGYMAQSTVAARLAMARLFYAEVTDKVTADLAKDSASRNSQSLNTLLDRVARDIAMLETKSAARAGGGMNRVVRGTPS